MLTIDDLHVAYGQSEVLHGLTARIEPGEIVAIMGRNGMGKTTLMKALMGILPTRSGEISIGGTGVADLKPHKRVALGFGYVPQGGMPAGMEGTPASRTQRFDAADVFPVDPVTLMTPHGEVRLAGVASVGVGDECRGAFDAAFSCHEWAMEGMQVLLDHAGSLRCLVAEVETETAIEAEAEEVEVNTAMCQANIGGDWIDLGDWSVRNGLNIAQGKVVCQGVAEAFDLPLHDIEEVI